ncbi:MAG: hypothetical protein ABFD49_05330 [Armatimonadota bacterium]|nr:hypothetical protein [bacterium]
MSFLVTSIRLRQESGKVDHFYLGGIDSQEELDELIVYLCDQNGAEVADKKFAPDDAVYIKMECNGLVFTVVFDEYIGAYVFPESESQVRIVHEFLKRAFFGTQQ